MGKMKKKTLPSIMKVTFGGRIDPVDGLEVLEWAETYLSNYNDPHINKIFHGVLLRKLFTNTGFEAIKKRMSNIPMNEAKDPSLYKSKYFEIIVYCFRILISTKIEQGIRAKSKDMIDFFKLWGYLTPKQIKYIHYMLNANKNKAETQSYIERDFSTEINSIISNRIKPNIPAPAKKKDIDKVIFDDSPDWQGAPVLEKPIKEKEVKKFFTLKEIRQKLSA